VFHPLNLAQKKESPPRLLSHALPGGPRSSAVQIGNAESGPGQFAVARSLSGS
jgi:hypothetical protein